MYKYDRKNCYCYWTLVRKLKVGAHFKLSPDDERVYIRGYFLPLTHKFSCKYEKSLYDFGTEYFDGYQVVCVVKE